VSALLFNAFRALGPGPTRREVALVAQALRESGDADVGPLLDYDNEPKLYKRCEEMAEQAGSYEIVALDLALAFHNPAHFAALIAEPDRTAASPRVPLPPCPRPSRRHIHRAGYRFASRKSCATSESSRYSRFGPEHR
jgi:hypothetical protein